MRASQNILPPIDTLLASDVDSINRALAKTLKDFEVSSKWFQIAKEHVLSGGKRVRPIICIASCELLGGKKEDVFQAALAVELLHNASLIHDDVVDRDKIRRGKPTIATQFDDFTAMLVGDLLFAISFEVASRNYGDPRIIGVLSDAVFDMVNGGSLGVKLRDELDVTEKTYLEIAKLKTAALFRAATTIGAICGGGDQNKVSLMSRFGTTLGIAFQIKDDLLGLIGKEEETGKPVNSDLRNREKTLIAIHALNNAKGSDAETLRRFFSKSNTNQVSPDEIKEIFDRTGSIEYAMERSWSLVGEAKKEIADLPSNRAKNILLQISDFAVTRSR